MRNELTQQLNERLKRLRSNEGCYNCGRTEEYPGADNPHIRYLCGVCNIGLARLGEELFQEIEAARPKVKRGGGMRFKKRNLTLATADLKRRS